MKIKICGICREEDVDAVNAAKPDYAGFVFYGKSRRFVHPDTAKRFRAVMNMGIVSVGVFVDAEIETAAKIADNVIISIAQLHGSENNDYISRLRDAAPQIQIIKAISPESNIVCDADFYLLDNARAGSGIPFDWNLIKTYDKPFFLAGGINLSNIKNAAELHPYAIDISSGAEINGQKDKRLIRELTNYVRKLN